MRKTYSRGTLQAHFEPRNQLRDYHKSDVQRRNENLLSRYYDTLIISDIHLKSGCKGRVLSQIIKQRIGWRDPDLVEMYMEYAVCERLLQNPQMKNELIRGK